MAKLATYIKRASFLPGNNIFLLSDFVTELEAIRNLKTSANMGALFDILCVSVCVQLTVFHTGSSGTFCFNFLNLYITTGLFFFIYLWSNKVSAIYTS